MRKVIQNQKAAWAGFASGVMFCLAAVAHGQQASDATAIGPQQAQQLDRARGIDTGPGERLQAVPGADVQPDVLTPPGTPGEDWAIGQPLGRGTVDEGAALERQQRWDDPRMAPPLDQRRLDDPEMMRGERGELGVFLDPSPGPGVRVSGVVEGSAAAEAGLITGDVILQVNGRGVTTPTELAQELRGTPAGQQVVLQVWRDGETGDLTATLRPAADRIEQRVGFRADEMQTNGDLLMRQQRLEQQLQMVMQELQMLRQEMQQLRGQATMPGEPGISREEFEDFQLDPLPEVEPPTDLQQDPIEREPVDPETAPLEDPAQLNDIEPDAEQPETEPDDLDDLFD